jgi:hypothetical protein
MCMKKTLLSCFFAASLFATAVSVVACGGDDDVAPPAPTGTTTGTTTTTLPTGTTTVTPDGGIPDTGTPDTGMDSGPIGPILFTDFVKDIVAKDTLDTTVPRKTETQQFLADPENPNAFPAAFFQ